MSNDNPQTLKDVALAALDNNRGMSGRQLDAEARKRGLKIVYTTINHMAAGTYNSRPGRKTLEALADLSGFTLEQVYAAAKLPMPLTPLRDELPNDADSLTGPQRRVVLDTIRLFAQQNLRAHALGAELEEARARHVDSSPDQKSDEVARKRAQKKASEQPARVNPAALDAVPGVDEGSGESDDDE